MAVEENETKKYFSLDEDFDKIIKNALADQEVVSIKKNSTGWTNIVYEVKTDKGEYFFRFPRDEFWTKTIVKDYEFAKYISGKTDFETVKLELYYDNNRPFSVHRKVEGVPLAERSESLSEEEMDKVSAEIAKFMYQMHQIDYEPSEIFEQTKMDKKLTGFLDELLNVHVDKKDMEFWKFFEFDKKDHNCLVHGDLNSSNILLDENNHIAAVIDFGFGGFGNPYFDIARIIGRCPEKYKSKIIRSYEELSNEALDKNVLDKEIDIWTNIDNAYINYMTKIGIYKPGEE